MERLTRLFGKSRQAYYYHKKVAIGNESIYEQVLSLVTEKRYFMPKLGGKKLYHILKPEFEKRVIKLGRDKFFEILRESDMLVKRKRNYVRTTNSRHWMRVYPNLVKNLFINRSEQVWVSDITYISTKQGHYYLSLVTDAYTKKIIGFKLSKTLEAYSSLQALQMALKSRRDTKLLIHHSDRGIQYCSHEYTETLKKHDIAISMTENGDPYENAIAERINGILKNEFEIHTINLDYEEAQKLVASAIITYNTKRPHLSCGLLTPEQAHHGGAELKKMWKSYPRVFNRIIKDLNGLSTFPQKEKK